MRGQDAQQAGLFSYRRVKFSVYLIVGHHWQALETVSSCNARHSVQLSHTSPKLRPRSIRT